MHIAVFRSVRDVVAAGLSDQQLPGGPGHLLQINGCEIVIRQPDARFRLGCMGASLNSLVAIHLDSLGRLASPDR